MTDIIIYFTAFFAVSLLYSIANRLDKALIELKEMHSQLANIQSAVVDLRDDIGKLDDNLCDKLDELILKE